MSTADVPSRIAGRFGLPDVLLNFVDHWGVRLTLGIFAFFSSLYLALILFGHSRSPVRLLRDITHSKTVRVFQFNGCDVQSAGWKIAPETAKVQQATIATKDQSIGQPEAVRIKASDSTGVSHTFDPPSTARFVEFVVRPGLDSSFEVQLVMRVHGQQALKYGSLAMSLQDLASVRQVSPAHWQVPNLCKSLGGGWVSLLCDVRGCFARSYACDGHELIGIKALLVTGTETGLAGVRLRERQF